MMWHIPTSQSVYAIPLPRLGGPDITIEDFMSNEVTPGLLGNGVHSIHANDITLSVTVTGDGPAVVLVHGFPELGSSWRDVVPGLVDAGYRVIVPDMRGYGNSDAPDSVDDYDVETLAQDLLGILDALGIDTASFVGHDWGASVVWYVAAAHRDRVNSVAGLSVPVMRPAPVAPLSIMRRRFGDDFYWVRIQDSSEPDRVLNADPRVSLATSYSGALDGMGGIDLAAGFDQPPAWLSSEQFDAEVEAFERSGFTGGLNWYRNIDRNWELWKSLDPIPAPAMFATGELDSISSFMPSTDLEEMCLDLRIVEGIEGAGHWLQQEQPAELSALLLRFLTSVHTR